MGDARNLAWGQPSAAPTSKETRQTSRVLLLASAMLFVAWSFAVPVFEAPDEPAHWQYARYLHQKRSLPLYGPDFLEANSPPMYYALIAPLAVETELPVEAFTVEKGETVPLFPPRYFRSATGDLWRYWPIRAARLVTVLISLVSVWFCYLAGTEASGRTMTGLVVGGLVAFLPQFTFRGMNVSNDSLAIMLSAASLYLIVRWLRRGFTWGTGVLAALAIAGAFLSKTIAIFLPGPLVLAVILDRAPWRRKLIRLSVLSALILVIIAPWLMRNQRLYGDLLAHKAMFTAVPMLIHIKPLWSPYFVTRFPKVLGISSIGNFGWMNVPLPTWAYVLYASFLSLAGLCCLRGVAQHRIDYRLFCVLLSAGMLNLMVVIYINLTFTQPQGRYMFPALPAIGLLLVLGLESVRVWSRKLAWVTVGVLAFSNLLILTLLILPTYWIFAFK